MKLLESVASLTFAFPSVSHYVRNVGFYSIPEPEGKGEYGLDQDGDDVEGLGVHDGHHHHAQEAHHLQHVPISVRAIRKVLADFSIYD